MQDIGSASSLDSEEFRSEAGRRIRTRLNIDERIRGDVYYSGRVPGDIGWVVAYVALLSGDEIKKRQKQQGGGKTREGNERRTHHGQRAEAEKSTGSLLASNSFAFPKWKANKGQARSKNAIADWIDRAHCWRAEEPGSENLVVKMAARGNRPIILLWPLVCPPLWTSTIAVKRQSRCQSRAL